MPTGLKITNAMDQTLYDSTLFAGVEHDDDNKQQHNDNNDNNNNDNNNNNDDDNDNDDDNNDDDNNKDDKQIQVNNEMHPDNMEHGFEKQQTNKSSINNEEEDKEKDKEEEIEDNIEIQQENKEEEKEEEEEEEPFNRLISTRSGRVSRPVHKHVITHQGHLQTQSTETQQYSLDSAKVIANTISTINHQFAQAYSLMKGIKEFGYKGRQATHNEMKQLHDRIVFKPIAIKELSTLEKTRAMESLIFLTEKKDGRIKARTCANGSTQREYTDREEATSPTAMTESHLIIAVIDAKQGRDVMTTNIPNTFVQMDIEDKPNGEKIIMKIQGTLVDMLVDISPNTYQAFVRHEGNKKILYVKMTKALYRMLQSSLLYYKKFQKDLEGQGFQINPYNPCVANRTIKGTQHTITWHVDDLKSSHVNPKVNDNFLDWLKATYANDKIGEIKAVCGKKHNYLAMTLDFTTPGVLKIDMTSCVKKMIKDFPENLNGKTKCPWSKTMFKVDEESPRLPEDKMKIFHTVVMKGMFLCKRARQDVLPGIVYLATRVKEPNASDWKKLVRLMNYLQATRNDIAKMSADDTQTIKW
jgi:hypothetical protein